MHDHNSLSVAESWEHAASHNDRERLTAVSDPDIEIAGPRGVARGHGVLVEWLDRAGISLTSIRAFAAGNRVVLLQQATWDAEHHGEASSREVATAFTVIDGRVTRLARFDTLDQALADAGLSAADEVARG